MEAAAATREEAAQRPTITIDDICMVESFLYHPLSLTFDAQKGVYISNDTLLSGEDSGLTEPLELVPPPDKRGDAGRCSDMPPDFNLADIVEDWANRKRYRILKRDHVIVSLLMKKMFCIDYVMEDQDEEFIVTVYYHRRRGGEMLEEVRRYMQVVEGVCNTHMSFYPTCLALCVYGRPGHPRVYATRVNSPGAGPVLVYDPAELDEE